MRDSEGRSGGRVIARSCADSGRVPVGELIAILERSAIAGGARRRSCKHNASMPNVLIRDVPDDIHANLQRRAEAAGQSLQQYLTAELARIATRPTVDEILARIAHRSGGRVGFQTAVDDLHDERARQ